LASRIRPVTRMIFWASWLVSATLFQNLLALTEPRYYLYAVVGFVGLGSVLLRAEAPWWTRVCVGPSLLIVALVANLVYLRDLPRGLVGYAEVAACLAEADRPGNVLMACWYDQELIFRFRAASPNSTRELLRSDRTLAMRVSPTLGVPGTLFAETPADVMRVLRLGRIRYMVTCVRDGWDGTDHLPEMTLAHDTTKSHSTEFAPKGRFLVTIGWGRPRHGWVYVWEYKGELPDGPSELSVRVPTAGLEIEPPK
jgi:hypothetical protein